MNPAELPQLFLSALADLEPSWRDKKFLVAYSGGLDSSALLHLAAMNLPRPLAAAHFNHGWRGPAADRDQAFAAGRAEELSLAFFTEKGDPAGLAKRRQKGLEEAARLSRYDFLARAARLGGADCILTAHQADDQAETLLMNLMKGAGPGGLAGIPPRRSLDGGLVILRPLLSFSRQDLKAWLTTSGRSWLEDESNDDRRFWRNAVRRELLPGLKQWNPRLLEALGRSAVLMRAEEDFWQDRLAELWPRLVLREDSTEIELDLGLMSALSLAERRRLVYAGLIRIQGARNLIKEPVSFAAVETALRLAAAGSPRGLDLPGGLRAAAEGPVLRLTVASRLTGQG